MDSAGDLPKGGVSPFGYPRINDRSHLPAAFRSVPRPSSPLSAKASTERPCHAPDQCRTLSPPPARRTKPRRTTANTIPQRPQPAPNKARAHGRPHTQHTPSDSALKDRAAASARPGDQPPGQRQPTAAIGFGGGATPPAAPAPHWRRSGSNRRPPACKAGALPTELRPRVRAKARRTVIRRTGAEPGKGPAPRIGPTATGPTATAPAWAREDLNLRPHAYQACALTN